mgnify:CR=1 FL=1
MREIAKRAPRWASLLMAVVLAGAVALRAADPDRRVVDAAKAQDKAALKALIQQKVDVNVPQADGATALQWAAHWNDLEMAEMLLRAGAKVDAANRHGLTPLSLACQNGSPEMIERLLRAGANVPVHCKGGLGRAGMMAARLLVELGQPADEAIRAVRRARPGAIETPSFINSFNNR